MSRNCRINDIVNIGELDFIRLIGRAPRLLEPPKNTCVPRGKAMKPVIAENKDAVLSFPRFLLFRRETRGLYIALDSRDYAD